MGPFQDSEASARLPRGAAVVIVGGAGPGTIDTEQDRIGIYSGRCGVVLVFGPVLAVLG